MGRSAKDPGRQTTPRVLMGFTNLEYPKPCRQFVPQLSTGKREEDHLYPMGSH
jgi:hypothetical protein